MPEYTAPALLNGPDGETIAYHHLVGEGTGHPFLTWKAGNVLGAW